MRYEAYEVRKDEEFSKAEIYFPRERDDCLFNLKKKKFWWT